MSITKASIRSVIRGAGDALERDDVDLALRLVYNFVEHIITNPVCASAVFASRDLDALCMRIGRHNYKRRVRLDLTAPTISNGRLIVFLVSRLQRSGGHSRLVQDFIRSQPDKVNLILSTEVAGPSDADYFSKLFANAGNVHFIRAPGGNLSARLDWLQAMLLARQPEHVYLFNHHQDSVAVAALVPELRFEASYCHHGDHHLCLGVHLSHLIHLDFHPMGFHCCREQLGIDNHYLPLTFEDKSADDAARDYINNIGQLTTATAARFNKIEVPYYVSYLDLIPEVLATTNGRHLHIGKLSPWALRRLRSNLSRRGIESGRLIYLEWTPSVWRALQSHHVDIYLASFPYGAALTLIEAMGAGIPVILHQHMYSRVLSCLELAYLQAFSWSEPQDLLNHLANLTPERLQQEGLLARKRYLQYHRPEILQTYFSGRQHAAIAVPPLREGFQPRWDEWAAWVDSQMTCSNLLRTNGFRVLRKMRLFFGSVLIGWKALPRG
jgi:glycosyltransferase involved in cell wall biosynthesis